MSRLAALALVATLAAPLPTLAKKFTIDSRGAKPRSFRITALCKGLDSWITPEVYKSSLFNKEGSWLKATPNPGFQLGSQDGKLVLLSEIGWDSGDFRIVGDASNLDDIRLSPGVIVKGHTEWDMGSKAWRVLSNSNDLAESLPEYDGEVLGFAWARDTALGMAAGTAAMHPQNFQVTSSALFTQWEDLIDPNDDNHDVAYFLAKATERYITPMRTAMQSADGTGKARLAAIHSEVLDAAQEALEYYKKDDWRPDVYVDSFQAVVQALGELQQEF